MTPQAIIHDIALRADDVLAGASNRAQARAGIEELITLDYLFLTPAERHHVVVGVMAVLEREGFFDTVPGTGEDDDGRLPEGGEA